MCPARISLVRLVSSITTFLHAFRDSRKRTHSLFLSFGSLVQHDLYLCCANMSTFSRAERVLSASNDTCTWFGNASLESVVLPLPAMPTISITSMLNIDSYSKKPVVVHALSGVYHAVYHVRCQRNGSVSNYNLIKTDPDNLTEPKPVYIKHLRIKAVQSTRISWHHLQTLVIIQPLIVMETSRSLTGTTASSLHSHVFDLLCQIMPGSSHVYNNFHSHKDNFCNSVACQTGISCIEQL